MHSISDVGLSQSGLLAAVANSVSEVLKVHNRSAGSLNASGSELKAESGILLKLPNELVVGYAVGFTLAGLAVAADPELVELLHERADDFRLVGKNPRFEISSIFRFGSHSRPG